MTGASILLYASIIGGLILLVVFTVWFSRRRTERAFAPVRRRFGLTHATDDRGRRISEEIEGDWQGCPVQIRYEPGGRHSPNKLIFTLTPADPLPIPGFIRVRRKRFIDRIAVAIGLAKRLWKQRYRHAGQAFIEAADDHYGEAVVSMADFRQAALPLVDYLNPSLNIESDAISLTLSGPFLFRSRKLKPVHVEHVFSRLHLISQLDYPAPETVYESSGLDAMPEHNEFGSVETHMHRSPLWPLVRPLTLVAAILMFVGPLLLWWGSWYPPLTWDLHLIGFTAGGVLAIIYGLLIFPAVRGHSRSLSQFSTLFFFGAVGFPTFLAGAPLVANALLDNSEPAYLEGRVAGKHEGKVKIAVSLADNRTASLRLQATDRDYDQIRGNDRVQIHIMSGFLGFPWTSSKQAIYQ